MSRTHRHKHSPIAEKDGRPSAACVGRGNEGPPSELRPNAVAAAIRQLGFCPASALGLLQRLCLELAHDPDGAAAATATEAQRSVAHAAAASVNGGAVWHTGTSAAGGRGFTGRTLGVRVSGVHPTHGRAAGVAGSDGKHLRLGAAGLLIACQGQVPADPSRTNHGPSQGTTRLIKADLCM